MEAKVPPFRIWPRRFEGKIDSEGLRSPPKTSRLERRSVFSTQKIIIQVSYARKLGSIGPQKPHQGRTSEAKTSISHIHSVFVPPRSPNEVILEKFRTPHLWCDHPTVPLYA